MVYKKGQPKKKRSPEKCGGKGASPSNYIFGNSCINVSYPAIL